MNRHQPCFDAAFKIVCAIIIGYWCDLMQPVLLPAQTAPMLALPLQSTSATFLRVFLRDKGPESLRPSGFQAGAPLYEQTRALHTERALKRRAKVLPENALLSLQDAPIFEPYLDSLRKRGAVIALRLRWRNSVLVTGANLSVEELRRLPFVASVQSARERLKPTTVQEYVQKSTTNCPTPNYGNALRQLALSRIPPLHAAGLTGQGVVIGVIDTGFRWKEQTSLKGASILGEYDVIRQDTTSTANRTDDRRDQDSHGTQVLSVIAAYDPPNLIGAAFGAQFYLAKTEDTRYERNIEQDNYAAGLEWLESRGVDIMTASLGYSRFDSTDESMPYSEMDGKTSLVARSVNDAARRGVLCFIPAGNDGITGSTLSTPADADSAVVVGAMAADSLGAAAFSSSGPTADGRIKPDLMAQGQRVVSASPIGQEYQAASGTSLSTPILAGGAALLLSAFPNMKPWEIREVLIKTASQAKKPDNVMGYGIADVEGALTQATARYGVVASPELLSYPLLEAQRVGIAVKNPGAGLEATLFVQFAPSQDTMRFSLGDGTRFATIPFAQFQRTPAGGAMGMAIAGTMQAQAFVEVRINGAAHLRIPRTGTLPIIPRQTSLPCGLNVSRLPIELPDNVKEGLFPNPISRATRTVSLLVNAQEPSTEAECGIFNSFGQHLFSEKISVNTGVNILPLDMSSLASGVYFARVRYNGRLSVYKFMIVP